MRDHRNFGVLEYVVPGVVKSLSRSFGSRVRVALACCNSSSRCGDEGVGISDNFQVSLAVFLSNGNDVKVVSKHSRDSSSFLHLLNPWSDQQSSERHREKASLRYAAFASVPRSVPNGECVSDVDIWRENSGWYARNPCHVYEWSFVDVRALLPLLAFARSSNSPDTMRVATTPVLLPVQVLQRTS